MPIIRAEVAIVGDSQVGKTSLINSFCGDGTKQQKQTSPTMYPELHTKKIKIPDTNYQVELIIIDTPSHRLALPLAARTIAESKFLLLVINGQDKNAQDGARQFLSFFRDSTTIDKPKGVLVQNYSFEGNEVMNEEQLQAFGTSMGLVASRVSAQNGKDIDLPFMMIAQAAYNLHKKTEGK
ncbi:Rab_GTPase-like family protein [Hexamita inflata]|uniref:Rab GTPase-like family protein n=1 Tax=Hexamita inflata TaxID=28002 RepID=A0AA86R0R5_9EUKA|nr:Rab GTPase-like family protein [Hexamita inflata]